MEDPGLGWPLTAAQGEHVAALAALIQSGGAARFLDGDLVAADARDFPDAWHPSLQALHALLARVAWLAYLDLEIAIRDQRPARPPDTRMLRKSELELLSAVPGKATFDLAALGNDDIAGRCAHAIGDAYLALLPGDPFRAAATEATAAQASTAAIYLGFGVLIANASMYRRHASRRTGQSVTTESYVERSGGLSLGDATMLLAIQDVVRDAHAPALDTLLPPQAEWLERWRAVLEPHEDELRALLGLADAPAGPPRTRPPAPRPPPAIAEPDPRRFNAGRTTFRVPQRGHGRMALGLGAGAAGFFIPGVGLIAGPVAMLGLAVAGFVVGARYFVCSDPACRRRMDTEVATCPGCGGTIVETIAHADLRLERLEAIEASAGEGADQSDSSTGDDADADADTGAGRIVSTGRAPASDGANSDS